MENFLSLHKIGGTWQFESKLSLHLPCTATLRNELSFTALSVRFAAYTNCLTRPNPNPKN